jgi:hypothetical protein
LVFLSVSLVFNSELMMMMMIMIGEEDDVDRNE